MDPNLHGPFWWLFVKWPDNRTPRQKFWEDDAVPGLLGCGCLLFILAGFGFAGFGIYKAVCP
jgi:hypothetical protein